MKMMYGSYALKGLRKPKLVHGNQKTRPRWYEFNESAPLKVRFSFFRNSICIGKHLILGPVRSVENSQPSIGTASTGIRKRLPYDFLDKLLLTGGSSSPSPITPSNTFIDRAEQPYLARK